MDPLTHIYDKGKAETLCGEPNASSRLGYGYVWSNADTLRVKSSWQDRKANIHESSDGEWLVPNGHVFFTLCPECYSLHVMIST